MQVKSDFIFIVPPAHLAEIGIKVLDYTNINATTLKPNERKVSLAKTQEMIFQALLQGYHVVSEDRQMFTLIMIINKSEQDRLQKEFELKKRDA